MNTKTSNYGFNNREFEETENYKTVESGKSKSELEKSKSVSKKRSKKKSA